MELQRSSRKPCTKGLPGKHPVGTDLSKPRPDQESLHGAYAQPDQTEPADLETASFPGADDLPVEQNHSRPNQSQNRTNRRTKQSKSKTKQADQVKPGMLDSEPTQSSVTQRRSTRRRNMPSRFKD